MTGTVHVGVFTACHTGFQYMAQIKDKETERDRGDWTRLTANERQRTENDFRHMGMIARFHNIMGNETIRVLGMLTSHIHNVFMHDVMVDRLAAMLNYFLKHLVRNGHVLECTVKCFIEFAG